MSTKIVVIGDVNGKIEAVFNKLSALHAKNGFASAIIAGSLFATDPDDKTAAAELLKLLKGQISVPLPTYFALGKHEIPSAVKARLENDDEVCPNLFFLGRRTTTKTSEKVRIVALGGKAATTGEVKEQPDDFTPTYTMSDIKVLKGASTADILVTSDWPSGITTGSSVTPPSEVERDEQRSVSDLCFQLRPRYHFSTSTHFYEREPFFHPQAPDVAGYATTRFISLAPFGNTSKQKWIYAFSLSHSVALPATIPTGVTASPLGSSAAPAKRKINSTFTRFGDSSYDSRGRSKRPRNRLPPAPGECFFCLSSPAAATHLVTSIGDHAYLTTAKGPLSVSGTFPPLSFPGHMLIIPVSHSPTLSTVATETRSPTRVEMHRYRRALQDMLACRSRDAAEGHKLGSVTFAISRSGGVHLHWQFVPVERQLVSKRLVEAGFKVEAENEGWPRWEETKVVQRDDRGQEEQEEEEEAESQDYLRVWIAACEEEGTGEEKVMTLLLDASFRFDLQFPRKVLAKLMGLESRMEWRDCGQTVEEEEKDAEAFKAAFKEFDFTEDG